MTTVEELKDLRCKLFSMSIDEAEGSLEESALRAAVAALGQIEQRAKQAKEAA